MSVLKIVEISTRQFVRGFVRIDRFSRFLVIAVMGLAGLAGGSSGFGFDMAAKVLMGLSIALTLLLLLRIEYRKEIDKQRRFDKLKQKADANPTAAKPAWDLAYARIELYVDRNLWQVVGIFVAIIAVMLGGFAIIGIGVEKMLAAPQLFEAKGYAAILTTGSGVLVEFIGATFLVIYKATMSQAQGYVSMLERINAVGMSAQLIESVNASNLKDDARINLAQQLLRMYGHADWQHSAVPQATKRRRNKKAIG